MTPVDPYTGFGAPVAAADPYANLGTPVDPYAGLGSPIAAGTVSGLANTARAAGRQSLAGLDVMGAIARGANRADHLAEADRLETQAARIDQLAPTWSPENRVTWATRAKDTAAKLRTKAAAMAESQSAQLASAAANLGAAAKLPPSEDYAAYQKTGGWDAVKQFLKDPVENSLNIATEGLVGSVPAMVAGAAGGMAAGPVGLAAGAGVGSFTAEYASTVLDTLRDKGVNTDDAAALAKAFNDPATMAEARTRGLARGIPVAIFDAISGGLAGHTVAPVAKQGVKQIAKAVGKEVAEQAALGAAGETAGQVSEQLATTGTVDPSKLKLKDIFAEAVGEIVPGVGQVATGAAIRAPNTVRELIAEKKPVPPPAKPVAQIDLEKAAAAKGIDLATPGTDLASEIGASLPDAESRDVLANRNAEATARDLANVKLDFGATVQSVQDALLTAGATPAQLDALDFQLRVLEERKDARRLKPEQVNTSLANTFLFQALPAADVFPLVSRLAADSANIQQLRAGIAAMRTAPTVAPAASATPTQTPTPAALTPEQRAAKQALLVEAEREATAAKARADAEREQTRLNAEAEAKAQTQRVRAENQRLAQLARTGRDETGKIVELSRVPDAELQTLNLEQEGLTETQIQAEIDRRAAAAERDEAANVNRGESLLEALAQVKLPGESATLPEELRTLIREGMTPKQRMDLVRAGPGELDRVAESLRGRGFTWAQTPADVIDHVQRALRGEKIFADQLGGDEIQFARRPAIAPAAVRDQATARWWENFRIIAPGIAREFELRFGSAEQLVAEGRAQAEDLTGEEEAAAIRKHDGSMRGIIYLFEKALRANTDAVTRLNLQHEIAHLFFDTLDASTRASLRAQWQREIATHTGPLFNVDGALRDNVALGVDEHLEEWFAERLAHANDRWAQRRTGDTAQGSGLIRTLAAELRALLVKLREVIERAFGREGYDDALLSDFRKFLNQGDRWNQPAPDDANELAGSFVRAGLPDYARREQATAEEKSRLAELEEQRTKLRAALAHAEEWDAKSVPGIEAKIAEIDRERIPLRKRVQPEAYTTADPAASVDAFEKSEMEPATAEADDTEPEAGATALFDDSEGAVAAEVTAGKFAQLEGSTLHRPSGVRQWLAQAIEILTDFRSSLPELPGGTKGRVFAQFRQGFSKLNKATEVVRKDASDQVEHILAPFDHLGRAAVSPERYREWQTLEATRAKELEAGRPLPPEKQRRIEEIRAELDAVPYHLFRKIVLYRDLYFRSRLNDHNGEPLALPNALTRTEVDGELRRLHEVMRASPHRAAIEEALRRHYALVKSVRDGLLARGYIIPEELRNPLYFPHLVLDKTRGSLQRVKLDTAQDFRGYLIQLTGSHGAIDTDYLTAMYYHLATVEAHNAREDIVETYWKPYDIKAELEKKLKSENESRRAQGLGLLRLKSLIPEGYVEWQVDSRVPLRPAYLIDHNRLAQRLGIDLADGSLRAQLSELGMRATITPEDIVESLISAGKVTWIVPAPVAKALQGILDRQNRNAGIFENVMGPTLGAWKKYILYAPQNVFRYTYGNLVADLEKLFSADPKVFENLLSAWREVRAWRAGGEASADLKAAFEEGVLSTITTAEADRIAQTQMDHFEAFLTNRDRFVGMMKRGLGFGVTVNEMREAAFRYAKFKTDLERMRTGRRPVYAGAYWRDVEAITEATPQATMAAKAAAISRATFGDYGDISVSGDALRRQLVPFYSWMEINFKYHVNLFRNMADMTAGAGAAQLARGAVTGLSRVIVARSVTGVLLRLALPYVAVSLWNNSGDREEIEKELGEDVKRRFHIVLGRDEKGRPMFVYLPTAFTDFMKWFGGARFAQLATDYHRGKLDFPHLVHEFLVNASKDNLNTLGTSVRPEFQAAYTAIARKRLGPDITDQRTVPDHAYWASVITSMVDPVAGEMITRAMRGPEYYSSRNAWDMLAQAVLQVRRRDPEATGYYATLDRINAYGKAHPGAVTSFSGSGSDPLAELKGSMRRALRAADVPGALNIYQKLLDRGYSAQDFESMVTGGPLNSLKREHREQFISSLSEDESRDVRLAFKFAERLGAFHRREKALFPNEKASPGYKEAFAARGGRPDVFAGVMERFAVEPDDALDMRADQLLKLSLRKH